MKTQLFVPKKIKVGYQHRQDTYTKKLAYIIYYDNKGVLRKEISWRGWIHDKDIENSFLGYEKNADGTDNYSKQIRGTLEAITPDDFDNIPTEGFVLNKGAGGHAGSSSSWNIRRETIRVWDPRDFEFEISVANLLFILENSNSYKGKGLEGNFVYAWEGKDLVLLPEGCQEYKQSMNFTNLKDKNVSTKELIEGATYLTKSQEEWIYLGRHKYHELGYNYFQQRYKNSHIFLKADGTYQAESGGSKLAEVINETPASNFADLYDEYHKSQWGSPIIDLELEEVELQFIKAPLPINGNQLQYTIQFDGKENEYYYQYHGTSLWAKNGGKFINHSILSEEEYIKKPYKYESPIGSGKFYTTEQSDLEKDKVFKGWKLGSNHEVYIDTEGILQGGMIAEQSIHYLYYDNRSWWDKKTITFKPAPYKTQNDIRALKLGHLYFITEAGTKIKYEDYKRS